MKGRDETTPAKVDASTFTNPADAAVLEGIRAAQAAGEDPFGDNDPVETAQPAAEQVAAAADEGTAPPDGGADDANNLDELGEPAAEAGTEGLQQQQQEQAAQAAPAPNPAAPPPPAAPPAAPQPFALQFKTRPAAELQALQAQLMEKKAKAFQQYSDSEIEAAEFAKIDAEVMQGLLQLTQEQTLASAQQQTALQTSQQALDRFKLHAKTPEGGAIDYTTDAAAAAAFDAQSQVLGAMPEYAALPDGEFFARVHSMVLTMRGVTPKAAAPTPPAARADAKAGIITLRNLPAAATPNAGGGVTEQLSRLQGLDFQDAVSRMPKGQRDAWLDS
jgi:hypothetical protein